MISDLKETFNYSFFQEISDEGLFGEWNDEKTIFYFTLTPELLSHYIKGLDGSELYYEYFFDNFNKIVEIGVVREYKKLSSIGYREGELKDLVYNGRVYNFGLLCDKYCGLYHLEYDINKLNLLKEILYNTKKIKYNSSLGLLRSILKVICSENNMIDVNIAGDIVDLDVLIDYLDIDKEDYIFYDFEVLVYSLSAYNRKYIAKTLNFLLDIVDEKNKNILFKSIKLDDNFYFFEDGYTSDLIRSIGKTNYLLRKNFGVISKHEKFLNEGIKMGNIYYFDNSIRNINIDNNGEEKNQINEKETQNNNIISIQPENINIELFNEKELKFIYLFLEEGFDENDGKIIIKNYINNKFKGFNTYKYDYEYSSYYKEKLDLFIENYNSLNNKLLQLNIGNISISKIEENNIYLLYFNIDILKLYYVYSYYSTKYTGVNNIPVTKNIYDIIKKYFNKDNFINDEELYNILTEYFGPEYIINNCKIEILTQYLFFHFGSDLNNKLDDIFNKKNEGVNNLINNEIIEEKNNNINELIFDGINLKYLGESTPIKGKQKDLINTLITYKGIIEENELCTNIWGDIVKDEKLRSLIFEVNKKLKIISYTSSIIKSNGNVLLRID